MKKRCKIKIFLIKNEIFCSLVQHLNILFSFVNLYCSVHLFLNYHHQIVLLLFFYQRPQPLMCLHCEFCWNFDILIFKSHTKPFFVTGSDHNTKTVIIVVIDDNRRGWIKYTNNCRYNSIEYIEISFPLTQWIVKHSNWFKTKYANRMCQTRFRDELFIYI